MHPTIHTSMEINQYSSIPTPSHTPTLFSDMVYDENYDSGADIRANERLNHPLNIVIVHGDPNKPNAILPGGKWDEDDYFSMQKVREALDSLNQDGVRYYYKWLSCHDTLLDDLRILKKEGKVDLVLQLCDEGWMNHSRMEMHVVAFLEMLGIPYTGASSKCIAITYDKQAVLTVAESINIPTPKSIFIHDDAQILNHGIPYPVFVKPNSTDGSFGITAKNVCDSPQKLLEALDQIRNEFNVTCPLVVQEYLQGRDINVACLGNEPKVLPISEECYDGLPDGWPKICGFESKWDEQSPYYSITTRPTTIPEHVQKEIAVLSQRLFHRLEMHDYARFDWRLDSNGNPRLLEANPNCGYCFDGHLPKTAMLAGIEYKDFFRNVLESAWERVVKGKGMGVEKDQEGKYVVLNGGGAGTRTSEKLKDSPFNLQVCK